MCFETFSFFHAARQVLFKEFLGATALVVACKVELIFYNNYS